MHFEALGVPIPVGPMAGAPVLVDLDLDGDLDVAVVCGPCCGRDPDPESGHVRILLNDGSGNLSYAGQPIKIGETSLGAAVGDINSDGIPDLACYQHSSYDLAFLIGKGDGSFEPPIYAAVKEAGSPHVHSVVLADVNNDGHLDALATLVDDHALAVLLGNGKGSFTPAPHQPYFAHQHPYANLQITDLTGDGNPDACLTDMRGKAITVLAGMGNGTFLTSRGFTLEGHTPVEAIDRPMALDLGDLDNDGDLDAVAAEDESRNMTVLMNDGTGEFTERSGNAIRVAVAATAPRLVDINNDGNIDILSGGVGIDRESRISITLGKGDGTFERSFPLETGGDSPNPAVGDLNGDGLLDIVTGNYESGDISVLIQISR
ncbi:MAG: hypothetical protein Phyf2KO_14340 [Phycisphaerales bacterium]